MHYDFLVIGTGQAGVPLAARLAESGKRTLLVERKDPGGTCVNYGCTPTKTMIASARAAHVARHAARLGVHAGDVTVDLAAVVERKDALVQQWRSSVRRRIQRAGERLTYVEGHARFVAPREMNVGGERHSADAVILNVGARPAAPPIPGLDGVDWLDNRRVMELRQLPEHLLILGGGYIGCEFGQMFRRFGAQVTMADVAEHLLPREDPDISGALEEVFRAEGIRLELGSAAREVSRDGDEVVLRLDRGQELRGSHLLVAVGRRPNTDDLGCDVAAVELDGAGFIIVDDHYRTSAEGVYAVGDVTGGPQFTHTSWDDHRILFDLLLGRGTRGRDGRVIPYTVFTDPQVAGVGITEKQAREQGLDYELASMPFGHIARSIEVDEAAGLMKVLLDPQSERILGAALVGAEAGELIHILVVLMQAGASARALVDAQMVHPTFAEGVQSLLMKLGRYSLS
ncbi:MAG: mercuric reductase [Gemmatimonadetes bacterium]|nr:mercuric reductase [Gemmatimonadota bacterium]